MGFGALLNGDGDFEVESNLGPPTSAISHVFRKQHIFGFSGSFLGQLGFVLYRIEVRMNVELKYEQQRALLYRE